MILHWLPSHNENKTWHILKKSKTGYQCVILILFALPSYLSHDLERLQKRAMKVIYPLLSYTAALKESGLSTLHESREVISSKTFAAIKEDESHKLHELLPKNNTGRNSLRNNRLFNLPKCKTERYKSSFIISHIFSQ